MEKWLLLLLAALTLAACKSKLEQIEHVDSYGYTERYTRSKEDFAKQGVYQMYDKEGRLMEEANYENDTLNGLRILYYETGDTQSVEQHRMGIFDGPYRTYYETGQLQMTGRYEANEMQGEWLRYYPNGQLMERVSFRENLENGPFTEYHENGKIKAEGTYRDGDNEQGLLKLYNEQGEHIRSMNCEQGVCRTTWERDSIDEN